MTKHEIPAPPRFLVSLFLAAAVPVIAMLLALAGIGIARGYWSGTVWCLFLAGAVAGGVPYAWQHRTWPRRH